MATVSKATASDHWLGSVFFIFFSFLIMLARHLLVTITCACHSFPKCSLLEQVNEDNSRGTESLVQMMDALGVLIKYTSYTAV